MRGPPDGSDQPEIKISNRLLMRLRKDGTLDEIVANDEFEDCEFHLEDLGEGSWWMRFYSTKGRPLDKELIVSIRPGGISYDYDEPFTHKDESFTPEESRTTPEAIEKEVNHFICYFGMQKLLECMVKYTESMGVKNEDYIKKLTSDLKNTLTNYESRYKS